LCTTPIDPTDPKYYVDAVPDDPNVPATTGVQELKHWQALLKYMTAFPDTSVPADGISDVPSAYSTAQGRIVKQ
jgi:hypothetical protein